MKKLLFTALAVVAFSGVAMANSVEVEESTILNNVLKIVEKQEQATPCEDKALDFYELVIDGGEDNLTLLNELIGACH